MLFKNTINLAQAKYADEELFDGKKGPTQTLRETLGVNAPFLAQQEQVICFAQTVLSMQFVPAPALAEMLPQVCSLHGISFSPG